MLPTVFPDVLIMVLTFILMCMVQGKLLFRKNPASISGMKITQLGITDMTYEKSHKLNVGFDFIAFNKLSVTIDGFTITARIF